MPEARRRELDEMLRGLAPRHQRQLSISTSNALDMFSVIEVMIFECISARLVSYARTNTLARKEERYKTNRLSIALLYYSTEWLYLKTYYCSTVLRPGPNALFYLLYRTHELRMPESRQRSVTPTLSALPPQPNHPPSSIDSNLKTYFPRFLYLFLLSFRGGYCS